MRLKLSFTTLRHQYITDQFPYADITDQFPYADITYQFPYADIDQFPYADIDQFPSADPLTLTGYVGGQCSWNHALTSGMSTARRVCPER